LRQLCTVGCGIFYVADVNIFLLVKLIMLLSAKIFILKQFFSG